MTIAEHDQHADTHEPVAAVPPLAGTPPLLPVMVATGEGAWVTDIEGRRYLDLTGDPALTFGHRHPALVAVATEQLGRVTATSAPVAHDRADAFAAGLADLLGAEAALPVATVRDAVEVAVAAAVAARARAGEASTVVVAAGSHDAYVTTGEIAGARATAVPFGDIDALLASLEHTTVAVLLEPVQAAAGIVVPPEGYLEAVRQVCAERGLVLVLDESSSGLGRLGDTVALDADDSRPDLRLLGPALGGGIVPVAAVVGTHALLDAAAAPASASPLASAIGHRVVDMLAAGELQTRARALAEHLAGRLQTLVGAGVVTVRSAGVWAGLDVDPSAGTAPEVARRLVARGVLVGAAGEATIVLAPPLVIRATELDWAIEQLRVVLAA